MVNKVSAVYIEKKHCIFKSLVSARHLVKDKQHNNKLKK